MHDQKPAINGPGFCIKLPKPKMGIHVPGFGCFHRRSGGGDGISAPVITSISQSGQSLQIFWNVHPDATDYEVWRGESEGSLLFLTNSGNVATYLDVEPGDGQTFFYAIKAITGAGTSPLSNVLSRKVLFEKMAFVNSVGASSPVVGDPDKPFGSVLSALSALEAAGVLTSDCTIAFQNDVNAAIQMWSLWITAMTSANGPRLMTAPGTAGRVKLTQRVSLGDSENLKIRLENIEIALLAKEVSEAGATGLSRSNAGSIEAIGGSVKINELNISAPDSKAADGNPGDDGVMDVKGAAPDGNNTSPPTAGSNGESADASGGSGSTPAGALSAWEITLTGDSGTIDMLLGVGQAGGNGGNGGNGSIATGGNGGNGGSSTAEGDEDGAPGGNGGNATSNGGHGGQGGDGGSGALVHGGSWVITSHDLSAGSGGAGGYAGSEGVATEGSGGAGGGGAGSGSPGANGTPGVAEATPGSVGSDGIAGETGSIGA